jgi:hypothetical protein
MLSPEELTILESSLLPALERHHLRLLAHGLRTLQQIAGRRDGDPPDAASIRAWAMEQPQVADDPPFAAAFCEQLESTARQLEAIARTAARPPLALDLEDLVSWAQARADARLSPPETAGSPPPG